MTGIDATEIEEGSLTFSFPGHCTATKYDGWAFYRCQFQSVAGGSKAVDLLCLTDDVAWLIEVKDYQQHQGRIRPDLGDEVAAKVRDTLSGLAAASANANERCEQAMACQALATKRRWRVVLHLEQPNVRSGLRSQPFDLAHVNQQLKRSLKGSLKAIDAHPAVVDRGRPLAGAPWTVRRRSTPPT